MRFIWCKGSNAQTFLQRAELITGVTPFTRADGDSAVRTPSKGGSTMNKKRVFLAIKTQALHEKTGIEPDDIIRYLAANLAYPYADLCWLSEVTGISCKTLKRLRKADHMISRVI